MMLVRKNRLDNNLNEKNYINNKNKDLELKMGKSDCNEKNNIDEDWN